jgi:molybdopterin-guanine dinucleotide biosynthesis protein A
MHSLFRALDGRELDLSALGLDEGAAFLNVNTPEDLVRAESLMDRRGPA